MQKLKDFAYNNPVRVAAFVSAFVALFAPLFSDAIPVETVAAFILSSIGLGEYAQRTENKKTDEALFTEVPEEE
jgi:CBS domain containing-hemolysin-like protein